VARLLLVDDEEDERNMFRDALRLRGHEVDVAASAAEALVLARSTTGYDVAIIDYVLPGKRGLDLLQELRELNPFLRSIIISGQIDHDALDAGDLEKQLRDRIAADRYLPKPTTMDSLAAAIDEVLQPAREGNWKRMATDAVATQDVKTKDVREMDRTLRKNRKKRKG
jgi:DNA-binding response OmpR family regulator